MTPNPTKAAIVSAIASRRKFQFATVIISETRTLTYATSLALMRHASKPSGLLIVDGTAPHRRFWTAVIAHGSKPSRLLRYKLRAAFRNGAASVQTSLVTLRDSIANDPYRQDHGDQGDEPQKKIVCIYWLDHIGDFGPP